MDSKSNQAAGRQADERALIEAAQRDPAHFGPLYESHFERIWAFVMSRVHDREAAQDITSETFQQALANLPRFEWRGVPISAWLYRIASNAISDHFQRNARQQPEQRDEEITGPAMADIEKRATLFGLVRQLPLDQQRVIAMRFAEGKSIREIATALGRSEGAVKQLQYRGIETLRTRMDRSHG
jgi:RNA polymerase sigma-70 factor, ECF subfamily